MEMFYDSEEEDTNQLSENKELKITNKIIGCNRQKVFKDTVKFIVENKTDLIQNVIKEDIQLNQRIFFKKDKNEVGYIEVFQNSSLSYSHQLSEHISFLFECDSKDNQRIDSNKCFGFRYYDLNNNYCTLLKSEDDNEDNYYFLEKLNEIDNEFYDKDIDCFKIIFDSVFSRYKNNSNKINKNNNNFNFQIIIERPLYEILGFSYSILYKSTDKFIFHKMHTIDIMNDIDFTSHIKKENDKTKLNIMPILFDGHISLLFFVDINKKRYFILSDPSYVHCKTNGKYPSINPFLFSENMRKNFSIYPLKKIQAFNSCSLWYYFQILCLINYNENIQHKKYIEAKNFVLGVKDSTFYFDCFNYYQYIVEFDKKLIEINPKNFYDDKDYFYYISNDKYLKDNIKIHKLCFLNQFIDFIEIIELLTYQSLLYKPGINELNEFRKYNEELIDFLIYLNYNINFLELNVKKDIIVIKKLKNEINKINDLRDAFIDSCTDFLSLLIQIDISTKNLEKMNSEISKNYKINGKYLYEIYNEIKDDIEKFHQIKNKIEEEFDLYPLNITGKILFPLTGFLYKSK